MVKAPQLPTINCLLYRVYNGILPRSWLISKVIGVFNVKKYKFLFFYFFRVKFAGIMAEGETQAEKRTFAVSVDSERVTGNKPPTSYWETLGHFVKGYLGTGIFAMGVAFKNSGFLFGPVLLIVFGIVNLVCQHKLLAGAKIIADKEAVEVRPSYAETVQYTIMDGPQKLQKYGASIAQATNLFLWVTELGFCCVYYLFVAEHLNEIMAACGYRIRIEYMLLIIFIPLWLSVVLLANLKILVPLSMLANVVLWIGIGIIFYYTSLDLPPLSERPFFTHHLERIPLAFGTCLYAFEGITFILPLQNEMGTPEMFTRPLGVINVGFAIVLSLYVAVGVMSYYKYGDAIQGSVFLNLPQDEILALIVKGLATFAIAATYTLHQYIAFEITYPSFYDKYGPFKHPQMMIYIYKTVPVLITFTAANLVPFLDLFISLVGAVSGTILALIVPPILELLVSDSWKKHFWIAFDFCTITIGIIGMIFGTVLSIYFIVLAFMHKY